MKAYLFKSFIILSGLFLFNDPLSSQSKYEISGGVGFPEAVNLKINYGKNIQMGASLGILPFFGLVGPIVEISYHFSGKSEFTDQPPWYILSGFQFVVIYDLCDNAYIDTGFFSVYPRIGRSFNFSKKTGINFDLGVILYPGNSEIPVFPSGSISFFIRL